MFTWICPKCGREVPPSYSECPNCAGASESSASPAAPAAAPTPVAAAPAAAAPPVVRSFRVPNWALTLLVALVLVSLGMSVYLLTHGSKPAAAPSEQPAAVPIAKRHPLGKSIEVTGVRITEDATQKAQVP
ncbi:MAG: hypothetical protein ABFD86_19720, partial [Bryobacteraceae bacterium]